MYKFLALLAFALLITSCTKHEAVAHTSGGEGVKDSIVKSFTLPDLEGKNVSLTDFKSSKAIVLMFISTQCPVSNDYNARMAAISNEYSGKGVTFLGINSNKAEDVAEIKDHAAKNGFKFSILKDKGNVVADQLAASFTPEIYVLSPDLKLLYHGRIDDKRRVDEVTTSDLKNALDEILSGKPVSVAKTKAFGCTIKRIN